VNNTKSTFLIQDLEILSGIKAHTIRIWEKRYNLLQPDRKNRNVRIYDLESLQKLLNISVLNHAGHKISNIAKLSDEEIAKQAKETAQQDISENYLIHEVLMAMFSFDEAAFERIYQSEIKKKGFEELFITVYAPVLCHIGVLWQTDAIKPVHEHFLTNLLHQKITAQTQGLKALKVNTEDYMHVLFLSQGEMHQIGMLFLNYLMRKKGLHTLYLGSNIPLGNLSELKTQFANIVWVNRMVIDKTEQEKEDILIALTSLMEGSKDKCWLIGKHWFDNSNKDLGSRQIEYFENFEIFAKKHDLIKSIV